MLTTAIKIVSYGATGDSVSSFMFNCVQGQHSDFYVAFVCNVYRFLELPQQRICRIILQSFHKVIFRFKSVRDITKCPNWVFSRPSYGGNFELLGLPFESPIQTVSCAATKTT